MDDTNALKFLLLIKNLKKKRESNATGSMVEF